jgi:hypothetical protein
LFCAGLVCAALFCWIFCALFRSILLGCHGFSLGRRRQQQGCFGRPVEPNQSLVALGTFLRTRKRDHAHR